MPLEIVLFLLKEILTFQRLIGRIQILLFFSILHFQTDMFSNVNLNNSRKLKSMKERNYEISHLHNKNLGAKASI